MKKSIAILLLITMLLPLFASCQTDPDDKGAIIPVYFAESFENLDPTAAIYDKDFYQISGLVFEGLTSVENGKIRNNLIQSWEKKYNEDRNEYFLTIKLDNTRWNDGRAFTADQVVYAWKRILSPEVDCPGAALLFDVKNARAIKAGEKTIDELGAAAVSIRTLEVQLESPIDPELFLEAISSPDLVPMRDDVVVGKEATWATNVDDIATNGKFILKQMDPKGSFNYEFSKFYKLNSEMKNGYNEFVKPFRLISDFGKTSADALAAFDNGEIYYFGAVTPEIYEERSKDIKSFDTISSYTYYFNCKNKTLSDPKVRQALSEALDRGQIAQLVGMGSKACEGFVPEKATGSSLGSSFRKEAGAVYSAAGDADKAKSLLKEAGVSSGSIRLTYREDRSYEEAVAKYAKSVWDALGFSVSLDAVSASSISEAISSGKYDVIGLDYTGLSTNPYAFLAPFAPGYCGAVVSVDPEDELESLHPTGYESKAYESLLDEVLAATERKARNEKLIELEKLFATECPAAALVTYKNNYLASSELSGLSGSIYGYTEFTNATLKDYKTKNEAYLEMEKAAEEAEEK